MKEYDKEETGRIEYGDYIELSKLIIQILISD